MTITDITEAVSEGWQCPVCGGGVAPTVERCPCVRLEAQTFTVVAGGGGYKPMKETVRVTAYGAGGPGSGGTAGGDIAAGDTRFMGATFSPMAADGPTPGDPVFIGPGGGIGGLRSMTGGNGKPGNWGGQTGGSLPNDNQQPTAEQIQQYIVAADNELGPLCCDAWVETLRNYLRAYRRSE